MERRLGEPRRTRAAEDMELMRSGRAMPATPLSASDGDDGLLVGGSGGGWDLEPNDAALGRSDAGPSRAQLKEEIREVLKEERLREELDKRQWVPGARIRRINARLLGCQCLCAVCKSIRAADPAVASGERPQQVHAPTLARGMLQPVFVGFQVRARYPRAGAARGGAGESDAVSTPLHTLAAQLA